MLVKRVPHHARTESRILELVDEGFDVTAAGCFWQQHVQHRADERQAFDSLRSPLGADLGTGNPPDLLGVRLEEDGVQAPAEPVRHPVLEGDLRRNRPQSDPQVTEKHEERVDRSQSSEGIHWLQRISEEFPAVVDARESRPLQQLRSEHVSPELLNRANLREESMAADIEAKTFVLDRSCDATDLCVLFEDQRMAAVTREQPRSRQAGRAAADDDDGIALEHRLMRQSCKW